MTIPITEQWEAWNGTGAVAFHNGQNNWFYPTPDYYSDHGGVQRAVSKDCVTFTKTAPHPFLPGDDVEISQTADGLFHLIKAGPQQLAKTKPLRNRTLVAWVRSADLNQQGGSVLTIEHPDVTQFDGIVLGDSRIPSRRSFPPSSAVRDPPVRWILGRPRIPPRRSLPPSSAVRNQTNLRWRATATTLLANVGRCSRCRPLENRAPPAPRRYPAGRWRGRWVAWGLSGCEHCPTLARSVVDRGGTPQSQIRAREPTGRSAEIYLPTHCNIRHLPTRRREATGSWLSRPWFGQ